MALNTGQELAIKELTQFLQDPEKGYFVLKGFAGTGKTFCMQYLLKSIKVRLLFTAPTNKATKVLRTTLTTDTYKPRCCTIYSALKLRLEANGELKELKIPDDPVDLTEYDAVVVDEASMIPDKLFKVIQTVQARQNLKFIFLGDPCQLPPVKEVESPVWKIDCGQATLSEVMRSGDAILGQATAIRAQIGKFMPNFTKIETHTPSEGVFWLPTPDVLAMIQSDVEVGNFQKPECSKIIAWRNITVNAYNRMVRSKIFQDPTIPTWVQTDRLILTSPYDVNEDIRLNTDDEGTVTKTEVITHPEYSDFTCWRLRVMLDTNMTAEIIALHEDSQVAYQRTLQEKLEAARALPKLWRPYWNFIEAFAQVRHAYAITAHRSQGSTYDTAYVDWRDILVNRDRQEAFRCLYVASTRPKRRLVYIK